MPFCIENQHLTSQLLLELEYRSKILNNLTFRLTRYTRLRSQTGLIYTTIAKDAGKMFVFLYHTVMYLTPHTFARARLCQKWNTAATIGLELPSLHFPVMIEFKIAYVVLWVIIFHTTTTFPRPNLCKPYS